MSIQMQRPRNHLPNNLHMRKTHMTLRHHTAVLHHQPPYHSDIFDDRESASGVEVAGEHRVAAVELGRDVLLCCEVGLLAGFELSGCCVYMISVIDIVRV